MPCVIPLVSATRRVSHVTICVRLVGVAAPVTTLAGSGAQGYADGTGTSAVFNTPWSVDISSDGVFALVVEEFNHRVRRVAMATGVVTTLAGSGNVAFADGTGTYAAFSFPNGVSISRDTSFALVTDGGSHRIRRIAIATGAVTTLAGSSAGFSDGAVYAAAFNNPLGVAVSPDATFALVTDYYNNRVRHLVIATGMVTTLAGSSQGYQDGTGSLALFFNPYHVAISSDGTFALVTDSGNQRVRRLTIATGAVTTLAGSGSAAFADGTGALASFNIPVGIAISKDASYALVADGIGHRVRRIALATGAVTTLAGTTQGFADGVGTAAMINQPRDVAIAPDGTYALIADFNNQRVRRTALTSPCPAGAYCPAGSSSPTPCAPGTYAATTGLSAPCSMQCLGGYYCVSGSSTATQNLCMNRTYCLPGSFQQTACPTFGFCASNGMANYTLCTTGYFCNATGLSAVSGGCRAGFYCPSGSSSPTQVACAPGYFCASPMVFTVRGAEDGQGISILRFVTFLFHAR